MRLQDQVGARWRSVCKRASAGSGGIFRSGLAAAGFRRIGWGGSCVALAAVSLDWELVGGLVVAASTGSAEIRGAGA